jgi:hypothetical protein
MALPISSYPLLLATKLRRTHICMLFFGGKLSKIWGWQFVQNVFGRNGAFINFMHKRAVHLYLFWVKTQFFRRQNFEKHKSGHRNSHLQKQLISEPGSRVNDYKFWPFFPPRSACYIYVLIKQYIQIFLISKHWP